MSSYDPKARSLLMTEYRRLKMGEIIQEGDEYDACHNPWHDDPVWVPATCIGEKAPNPAYVSHRMYRRPISGDEANQS